MSHRRVFLFFLFFFNRIRDICLPYHVYSILLRLLTCCIGMQTTQTQSQDCLTSNEIVLNYCVCLNVVFFFFLLCDIQYLLAFPNTLLHFLLLLLNYYFTLKKNWACSWSSIFCTVALFFSNLIFFLWQCTKKR